MTSPAASTCPERPAEAGFQSPVSSGSNFEGRIAEREAASVIAERKRTLRVGSADLDLVVERSALENR